MRVIANRYRLEQPLGRGGMGEVYLATQVGVGNRVAVKFLVLPPTGGESFTQRFLSEARIGVTLEHPGIARVLDAGQDEGQLFIVFEFVDGEDLRQLVHREGPLPWARARDIVFRLGEALAYAHSRGVVHRDVKPENVRVRSDLMGVHVKVLDFGIARAVGDARLTAQESFTGTPAYMAPEQIDGLEVDGRADLYCLGLILFELVTGSSAVRAKSPTAALVAQMTEPLPLLGDREPERAWPALDRVLRRTCAKEREARFADVAAFLAELQALPEPRWTTSAAVTEPAVKAVARAAGPTLATPGPQSSKEAQAVARTRPSKPRVDTTPETARGRARWPVGVTVLLALGVAAGAALWPRGSVDREEPVPNGAPDAAVVAQPMVDSGAAALTHLPGVDSGQGEVMAAVAVDPPAPLEPHTHHHHGHDGGTLGVATAPPTTTPPTTTPPTTTPPTTTPPTTTPPTTTPPPTTTSPTSPTTPTAIPSPPTSPPRTTTATTPPKTTPATSQSSSCPQLEQFGADLSSLSADELTARYRASRYTVPSAIERTVITVNTMADAAPPEKHDCVLRANLASQVVAQRALAKVDPMAWVHAREASAWREIFLTAGLKTERTRDQRDAMLQDVDRGQATLEKGDVEYMRRWTYGQLIGCELTDAELSRVAARRQAACRTWR